MIRPRTALGVLLLSAFAAGCDAPPAAPLTATAPNQAVVRVPGMVCDVSCAPKVRAALAGLPFVGSPAAAIATDVKSHTARFEVKSGAAFDFPAVVAALEHAGYENVELVAGPSEK